MSIEDDLVFVAYSDAVYAIESSDGNLVWSFVPEVEGESGGLLSFLSPSEPLAFYAPPAPTGEGSVIVGDYTGTVYSLDRTEGTLNWKRDISADGRIIGGPTVSDGMVYVPSSDHKLYALSVEDGSQRWEFPTEGPLWSAPLVVDDTIYLASMDHRIYALDKNGRNLWTSERMSGAIADTPSMNSDQLLVGTFDKKLEAVRAADGKQTWEPFLAENWVWGGPVIEADVAYFGDLSGNLYEVSTETGKSGLEGQTPRLSLTGDRIVASPVIALDQLLVVTENGVIRSEDLETRDRLWETNLEGKLLTKPVVTEEFVLVALTDAEDGILIQALDRVNGTFRWPFTPEEGE
jgi:outer membrane protein assembly factor BamB